MSSSDSHLDVIESYLADGLSSAEETQLFQALSEDASIRRELLIQSIMDVHLEELLREDSASPVIPFPAQDARTSGEWWRWAAVVLLLLGTWAGLSRLDPPAPVTPDPGPVPVFAHATPTPVAEPVPVPEAPRRLAVLVEPEERVEISSDEVPAPQRVEGEMYAGDTVVVPEGTRAQLQVEEGPTLTLHPGTSLKLEEKEDGLNVVVYAGGVDARYTDPSIQDIMFETDFLNVEGEDSDLRLLAFPDSSWVALGTGEVTVTKRSSGETADIRKGNYAAVAPDWPFQRMDYAVYCPMWRARSMRVAGDIYPKTLPENHKE